MEDLYINIKNYNFIHHYNFYYQLNDKVYLKNWNRPSDVKLYEFINYFKSNFNKKDYFNIYLSGRFNSNQKNNTWDIDLIICYKDIKYKNYSDIYDCLFFLKDSGLEKFSLLIDPCYYDYIYTLKDDIPENMITKNISDIEENIRNRRLNQMEIIVIYKTIVNKLSKSSYAVSLNKNIYKEIILNDKSLYIINYNKISFKKMIKKKISYIKNGCKYYDIKLL